MLCQTAFHRYPHRVQRNIALYPWFRFCQNLLFYQAIWFLYFQDTLGAAEAILLYALFEVATTVLEVPSGYASDRLGRRITLIASAACGVIAIGLQINAETFATFAIAQLFLGGMFAFASGTDSALLYESLTAEGRSGDTERQELRAWRFAFTALAISALIGGVAAYVDFRIAYILTTAALIGALVLACMFKEPPHEDRTGTFATDWTALRKCLARPVLIWLFTIFAAIHIFGHLPFVFGQPFILEVLNTIGLGAETPPITGAILFIMLMLSLAASLAVEPLRRRMRMGTVILIAFAVQIGISAALAMSSSVAILSVLLLRMLPSAFLAPLITARIQGELSDRVRATFVSLKSFTASMIFAGTLALSATWAGETQTLPISTIQTVLWVYVAAGTALWLALAFTVKRARIG
ncbi:MAG: MFS transporter [Shimia sp.]